MSVRGGGNRHEGLDQSLKGGPSLISALTLSGLSLRRNSLVSSCYGLSDLSLTCRNSVPSCKW